MENKIKALAVDLVDFYHDLDPYGGSFTDALEGAIVTYDDLMKGNALSYVETLKEIREESEDTEIVWYCDDLIERLEAL